MLGHLPVHFRDQHVVTYDFNGSVSNITEWAAEICVFVVEENTRGLEHDN
jgi:hypothetical protein